MMGRTHSVHAEPTTFGLKLAGWAFEVDRGPAAPARRRPTRSRPARSPARSGRTATSSRSSRRRCWPTWACASTRSSTQIVQRDRHAAFLAAIAILGGSLERLATEIRNLQHTEIGEVMEPFRARPEGLARRCPTSATRSCPSGSRPGPPPPRLRRRGAREPAAVARARHQPLLGRARDPARRDDPARLHAREDRRPRAGPRRPARADAREHRARPRPARLVARARWRWSSVAGSPRGGVRDRPARRPASPPTSAARCASCLRPRADRSPARLALADLDACFDDAAPLRHVPEVIARLDAGAPPSCGGRAAAVHAASCDPARSATCTRSTTTGCCSSRRTGSARSTSSCRPRSRTRAAS